MFKKLQLQGIFHLLQGWFQLQTLDEPLFLCAGSTRGFFYERPCYLRGGVCLKRGTPGCVPFRGPCREFTVCCKRKN
uniref:Uncharacterized protein n=1 Tax=Monodelphis domestica TaxID=13616 RepID=A0A5F8G9M4_MONDO